MALPPIVAVEIGTTKIVALVGEYREDGHVLVTGMGEHPSAGVRKGEVIDLENAVLCVRSALEKAEESGNVTINQVHVAVSGGHIRSVVNRGAVPVLDPDGEITRDDIEQVMEVARAVNLAAEREIMHTICCHFQVDDGGRVVQPVGMEGARLSLDMLVLHGVRSRLHNIVKAVSGVPIDVEDVVFGGLCSAMAVLTDEQRERGAIVIDLGGGTTDYVAYCDGALATAGALGVGGDHVTNDIALAFNVPSSQAEKVKREHGSAVIGTPTPSKRVSLPAEVGFTGRTISVKSLQTVINARIDEVFTMVRHRVDELGLLHQMGAGVVLTGGGAHLGEVTDVGARVFGLPCVVGKPRNVSGLATATEGPEYATSSGLIQYGFKTALKQGPEQGVGGWLRGLFGR